ncbi:MAG: DUF134 domain-containing protein [Candidatus Woesearchaeota archaeon]
MVRPKRFRYIWNEAKCNYFKPKGISINQLAVVNLNLEELEAIRLIDYEELEQIKASEKMNISQPTFSRILNEARKKVADAIVNGKAIKIEGGNYKMPNKDGTGPLGRGPKTGRGLGNCQEQTSDILKPLSFGFRQRKGKRFQRMKNQLKEQTTQNNEKTEISTN